MADLPIFLGGGAEPGATSAVRGWTNAYHAILVLLLALVIITTGLLIPLLNSGGVSPSLGAALTPVYIGLIISIIVGLILLAIRAADAFSATPRSKPESNPASQFFFLTLANVTAILVLIFAFLLLSSDILPHMLFTPLYIAIGIYIVSFCMACICTRNPYTDESFNTGAQYEDQPTQVNDQRAVQVTWNDL